jgi:hypothetical protein
MSRRLLKQRRIPQSSRHLPHRQRTRRSNG